MTEVETQIAVIRRDIEGHDKRISSLHSRVGEAQIAIADQSADIKVIKREVEETKEDVKEFKDEFGRVTREMRESNDRALKAIRDDFNKKFETLTSAARWGTGTMIAALGILITLLAKGG